MKTIATLAQGRDNNFNLLRMIAATAVLVSHAYPIAGGPGTPEPLEGIAPGNLGRLAVAIFFSVSGFFIAKSFDRRDSLVAFLVDRVLRIYPGLLVVLVLTVALLGPLLGSLPAADYWKTWATLTYIPHNLSLYRLQWALPGLFAANPGGASINGSLWTLGWEVGCYAMVVAVGLTGLLLPRRFWLFLIVYGGAYLIARVNSDSPYVDIALELSLPFVIGMAFYVYREAVPLHWGILLASIVVAIGASFTPAYREAFAWLLAYASFWFGALSGRALHAYNRLGDYSYGMYIYAFPAEQAAAALVPGIGPLGVIGLALPATLICAILSWMLVERPALARRHAIGRRLAARVGA